MADDKLEIKTAIDTDGIDGGISDIKSLVTKGMDALNNSISECIFYGLRTWKFLAECR